MNRRAFLGSSVLAGLAVLIDSHPVLPQIMGNEPDPAPLGPNVIKAIYASTKGRVLAMDSLLYIYDSSVTGNDVVIAGSYCGAANLPHAIKKGVKGMIAHDAGVGKDRAGIGALSLGDKYDFPVAAVECMSASISNGRSMAQGVISYANAAARKLGVEPRQKASEAGKLLLDAAPGHASDTAVPFDKAVYEKGRIGRGRILVSSALTNLNLGEDYSNDVFASGSHSGTVFADLMSKWRVKGWISNDAGMAKNNTGVGGLPPCGAMGIAAAGVAAMSARIGDGLSTYEDGIISVANEVALGMGVRVGMKGAEALRTMLS